MSILVTGGSKGIGRAVCVRFATPGNAVFINYHSDDTAARDTADAVSARDAIPHLIKADVSTPDGAAQALYEVRRRTERLDQLVHCAVRSLTGPTLSLDPVEFSRAVELNGSALLYLVHAALPVLGRGSCVCFLSSRGTQAAVANYAALGAPKAMGEVLIRYLAVELAPHGIRANTVAAGPMDTDAFRAMFPDNADERLQAAANANPSGRGVAVDDTVDLIEFLASDAATMLQGQRINVDGGLYLP